MTAAAPSKDDFAETAAAWFRNLQSRICTTFEAFESTARFEARSWGKPEGHRLRGGGEMRLMRGAVFEKVGVNVSHVWGEFSPEFRAQIPGAEASFVACGISLVAHMVNPFVPAVHMNLRFIRTGRSWFGGGADLTPTFAFEQDTVEFHEALKQPCEAYRPGSYQEYKEWCDRYFFLPHRQEPRGVGGIFFDELSSGDLQADFAFVRSVGEAFLSVYPRIVARRRDTPYGPEERERLLFKRGRYVEFNLVYDRGTRFGLGTDADPDAYLMSLPPLVKW